MAKTHSGRQTVSEKCKSNATISYLLGWLLLQTSKPTNKNRAKGKITVIGEDVEKFALLMEI